MAWPGSQDGGDLALVADQVQKGEAEPVVGEEAGFCPFMVAKWSLTIDCAYPAKLAGFWALALGYEEKPAPAGFGSWEDWFSHHEVPEDEWDDGAYLSDPDGVSPSLSFLKVPEPKVAKNRLHIDVQVGGGRETPWEVRWPRVVEAVGRLTAAGATVVREDELQGRPDHVVMADPEGNEFCLV